MAVAVAASAGPLGECCRQQAHSPPPVTFREIKHMSIRNRSTCTCAVLCIVGTEEDAAGRHDPHR